MDGSANTSDPLTTLQQHLRQLQAGVSNLPSEDQKKVIRALYRDFIKQASDGQNLKDEELLPVWNDVFNELILNGLAAAFAGALQPEKIFYICQALTQTTANAVSAERIFIHHLLNFIRRSSFLKKIYNDARWPEVVGQMILRSNFTVSCLLQQRIFEYPQKVLHRVLQGNSHIDYTFAKVGALVEQYARALAALTHAGSESPKVAFLMENSLNMILLDLACLTSGIVNVMIPANSVPSQIEFILKQTEAAFVLASTDKQLAKLKSIKGNLPHLKKVVLLQGSSIETWVMSLEEMLEDGGAFPPEHLLQMRRSVAAEDLASIMYTSGTTGEPKGIMFSQMNIVYKRFCRAMALPEIGEEDRYLSYLPLYHTFGRWLEMMGSIFWAAQYTFMENPALPTMLDNMQRTRPTIFISIPKKWIQLYEYIAGKVDIEMDEDAVIAESVKKATGGALRWGLSAAGYLEPEVFRFFQRYGIHLMSGFGMTEATGGITMTPPERYVENSLGQPLPGIEVKLGEDGEMLIRGDYVMIDYYGLPPGHSAFVNGWFPTGDIMRQDENGFYEIVDRKKEIYKNVKGETIAPQRVENLFRDFEYVQQVFLVGDHRPFNTALIFPNNDHADGKLRQMDEQEKQTYFASVVVTVNKFLAPFERIVDFRLTNRPFSAEHGEVTPKGTYKRRVIERNFADDIQSMYTKNYITLFIDRLEIRIPNWFLREKGCLINDITADANGIFLKKYNAALAISKEGRDDLIRVGSYFYKNDKRFVDFQIFLANPFYWLGNKELIDFAGESIFQWYRLDEPDAQIRFHSVCGAVPLQEEWVKELKEKISGQEKSLFGLNRAVLLLHSEDEPSALLATEYLRLALSDERLPIYPLTLEIIRHPEYANLRAARRKMLEEGHVLFRAAAFKDLLKIYLDTDSGVFEEETIGKIIAKRNRDDDVAAIHAVLKDYVAAITPRSKIKNTPITILLDILAEFGIRHPTKYKRVRQLIVRYQLREDCKNLSVSASMARKKLLQGFRSWLGENQKVAVDIETGEEYQWRDVIIFDEQISAQDRQNILQAFTNTSLLREAIFLFSSGNMVRLYDIPPGGVWLSLLQDDTDKAVFRVSVQTRYQGSYDFVLNAIRPPLSDEIASEMNWLIHAGAPAKGLSLIEDFGGFWQEYNMWTEDFYPGDSLNKFIRRTLRRRTPENELKLSHLWPFFIRTAVAAHVSFLRRTGFKWELSDLSPKNIVIPHHDYQTGMRIVSIARRQKTQGMPALLLRIYNDFVRTTEKKYPFLTQDSHSPSLFAGVLDVEGRERGLKILKETQEYFKRQGQTALAEGAERFIRQIEEDGFVPKPLYFAISRFHRWHQLNSGADLSAQAMTLNELYDTYRLPELEGKYPETRIRFFLETVFADSDSEFRRGLEEVALKQRTQAPGKSDLLNAVSNLQRRFKLSEKEMFFLSRLTYPHLRPTDFAALVSAPSIADVVVRLDDYDGMPFFVRRPVSPKEISALHQLFLEVNLPVSFHPEHRFLVAVSERGYVIGGLFYKYTDERTVYMEKIVVSSKLRRKGISDGVMKEFFNRLRDEKVRFVTTGFFRPEYFYRFGFKIKRKYAGLVKDLEQKDGKG